MLLSALISNMDLYVVNMPQSTWMVDRYFEGTHDGYKQLLRSVVGDTPFLDLGRLLSDAGGRAVAHPRLHHRRGRAVAAGPARAGVAATSVGRLGPGQDAPQRVLGQRLPLHLP